MTGGPTPIAGSNPFVGAYQVKQFDTSYPGGELHGYTDGTVLDALADPPEAGVAASDSPDKVFESRDNPPPGSGGNPGGIDL